MKTLRKAAAIGALLAAACSSTAASKKDANFRMPPEAVIQSALAVWRVDSPISEATAFPVSASRLQDGRWRLLFLTAGHIAPPFDLYFGAFKVAPVSVHRHKERDLSVTVVYLDADLPLPPLVPLARTAPRFGDALWAVGFMLDSEAIRMTYGFAGSQPGTMSAAVAFGASGGPILNARGEAVGLTVTAAFVPNVGVAWHVSRFEPLDEEVHEWLSQQK